MGKKGEHNYEVKIKVSFLHLSFDFDLIIYNFLNVDNKYWNEKKLFFEKMWNLSKNRFCLNNNWLTTVSKNIECLNGYIFENLNQ